MPTPRPPPKGPLPANPYEIAVAILYFLFVTPIAILCGVITALRDEARRSHNRPSSVTTADGHNCIKGIYALQQVLLVMPY